MSNKAHVNPYRKGSLYHGIFAYIQKKQVFTRSEVMEHVTTVLGKSETAANASVTVVLSPRKDSKRGDCRGSISAQGHVYFVHKCQREVKGGIKGEQKYRLCWRATVLEPRVRTEKIEVTSVKDIKDGVVEGVVTKPVVKV